MASPEPLLPESVRADLLRAARLVTRADGRIRVDGVPVCGVPRSRAEYGRAVRLIEPLLYSLWYAGIEPPLSNRAAPAPDLAVSHDLIERLRETHAATPRFESGWVALAPRPGDGLVATRGDEPAVLAPRDYRNLTRAAGPARAGDSLEVTARRERIADGWWVTWNGHRASPAGRLLRVYWHCGADGAPALVADLTSLFESRRLAYSLKCPAHESLFGRRDAVVCYLPAGAWVSIREGLLAVLDRRASDLRDEVPALTLPLGRGVGLAEDPGGAQSFGQSRARAVADGLVAAAVNLRARSDEEAVRIVAARLSAYRISAREPHLARPQLPRATW
jgi:hypothetical protein